MFPGHPAVFFVPLGSSISPRPYGGNIIPVVLLQGWRFVLLTGSLSERTIADFLFEFYHPLHDKGEFHPNHFFQGGSPRSPRPLLSMPSSLQCLTLCSVLFVVSLLILFLLHLCCGFAVQTSLHIRCTSSSWLLSSHRGFLGSPSLGANRSQHEATLGISLRLFSPCSVEQLSFS